MAFSEQPVIVSLVAATTFSSTGLYKFVELDAEGHVIDPASTAVTSTAGVSIGTLYGVTQTTSTEAEAVPVAVGGIFKAQMAASTLAAGGYIAASTAGLGTAPTTDNIAGWVIVKGSSGSAGRIVSVMPLNAGSVPP